MTMHHFKTIFIEKYTQHNWIIALSILSIILSVIEIIQIASPYIIFWCLYPCYFLALLFLPAFPRQASWIILVLACMAPFAEGNNQPFLLSAEMVALGILAYMCSLAESAFALAATALAHSGIELITQRWEFIYWITAVILCITCFLSGIALKQHQEAIAAQQRRSRELLDLERLKNLETRNKFAIRIHDSLTNALSDISLLANSHITGNKGGPEINHTDRPVSDWQLVASRTDDAFRHIHEIISLLSHTDSQKESDNSEKSPRGNDLKTYLACLQAHHAKLGYKGNIQITGLEPSFRKETYDALQSLLAEIFTNIQRHAVPGPHSFDLFVTFDEQGVQIRQLNDAHETVDLPEPEISGKGLTMHRQLITSLGGSLSWSREGGQWLLYAFLPCKDR